MSASKYDVFISYRRPDGAPLARRSIFPFKEFHRDPRDLPRREGAESNLILDAAILTTIVDEPARLRPTRRLAKGRRLLAGSIAVFAGMVNIEMIKPLCPLPKRAQTRGG